MKLDNQFKQDLRRMRKVWQVLRKMGKSLKSFEKNGKKSDKIWEKCEQDDEQKLQSLTVKTNFKKHEK